VDWVARLAEIVDRYEEGTPRYKSGEWKIAFEKTGYFGPLRHAEFGYVQTGTPETVVERVASSSFIAALPAATRERVLADVRTLIREHPATRDRGEIGFPYRTDVYVTERV
jgi:hypothetical protein